MRNKKRVALSLKVLYDTGVLRVLSEICLKYYQLLTLGDFNVHD